MTRKEYRQSRLELDHSKMRGHKPDVPLGAHKFVSSSAGGGHPGVIFCVFCGHVAYSANSSVTNPESQKIAKNLCPLNSAFEEGTKS